MVLYSYTPLLQLLAEGSVTLVQTACRQDCVLVN